MGRDISVPIDLVVKVLSVPMQFLDKQERDHLWGLRKKKRSLNGGQKVGEV